MTTIPTTREEAIAALVESDVAQWGEEERAASMELRGKSTYGMAMTELASRATLAGDKALAKALTAAAKGQLTRADRSTIRSAG